MTNIPVCWENPNNTNAQERGWVQNSVQRTWEANSLVRFTGWGTCTNTSTGVRIQIVDDGPHTTGLGTGVNGVVNGMHLNFTFTNWSTVCQNTRQFCIEAIAAHEFGHALAFAHEQNRPDTTDASCVGLRQGTNGTILVGPWDPQSIMNYCSPQWNNNGLLSNVDINMVRTGYGNVPTYNTLDNSMFIPVIAINGVTYSGLLTPVGSKWHAGSIQSTTAASSAVVNFSGTTLDVPFLATFDGTNITGFFRASLRLDADGLFSLISTTQL